MKLPIPLLLAALATSVCLQFPATAFAAQADPEPDVEQIRLRAGEPPAVNLTGELLYRILASEIAAHRGQYEAASQGFLDLATDTLDPRLAKKAFQAAVIQRNMPLALKAAQQWAFLAPDDPEAVASALALAASNGQTAGLATTLAQRIAKADDKNEAIGQAASIVSKLNDKNAALKVLDNALTDAGVSTPLAHLALSDAAWEAGDAARAVAEAEKALAMDSSQETAAQRMLEYGMRVDPAAAIAGARDYLQKHPNASKLSLLLANHLVRRQDFEGALSLVQDMRQNNPEDFDLAYTEAEINFHAQRYDRAKALLNEYIAVQTQRRQSIHDKASNAVADASDARLLLVKIAEKQNDLTEAIRQLGLIDDPALTFQARMHQAVLYGRQGNLAEARKTIDALEPQDDREAAVKALTMATIYRDAGRTEQAIDVLVKADEQQPDTPEIKYDLAMLYERQGRFDDFEALMSRVIELDPDNANAYNSLGYTYADRSENLDEAGELLARAIELEPNSPYILDSLGWYYYRIGDYGSALRYLQRAYQLMPSAEVAAHLGEVLWVSKRQTQAREIWKEGLADDANNEVLLKTLKRFGVQQ